MSKERRDFRGLGQETQAAFRRRAFGLLDAGRTRKDVASIIGVHEKTIGTWVRRRTEIEERDGDGRRRGRRPGEQRFLDEREEARIKRLIETKTPDECGIAFSLWSRKAIRDLVRKEYGETLAFQTISSYAKRWGLSPQRPAKCAIEQDPGALRRFREETFPKIREEAEKCGAEIHFADETGISLSTFYARSYAPKGKTPIVRLPAKKVSLSMISSVASRGDFRFLLYKGALDADGFIDFLGRLVKESERPVFLVVDNLRVHRAKKVRKWVEKRKKRIRLFSPCLPTPRSSIPMNS